MDVAALIFDFDGTILDTETPIFEEWCAEYRRHGQALEVDFWGWSIGTHGVVDLAANLAELTGSSERLVIFAALGDVVASLGHRNSWRTLPSRRTPL